MFSKSKNFQFSSSVASKRAHSKVYRINEICIINNIQYMSMSD